MRKLLIILGVVFLVQLVWVSTSQAAVTAATDSDRIAHEEGPLVPGDEWVEATPTDELSTGGVCRCRRCYVCSYNNWGPCCVRSRPAYHYHYNYNYNYYHYPQPRPYCATYHRVAPGQTLYGLSRAYGVPAWAIARANGLYNWNYIQAGCTLCIPHR
ncbi:MAG TPA: LysM peptidoglycan-binding domain-containing protein [Anaerolineae bacterium]|nr:LysM peptidoglycan-binding domain-containing protein [Anaerolineae bacterium]HMR67163.1 LysM peptidoglycan-binding domain-containing protein [Anaerolineae bacterium]